MSTTSTTLPTGTWNIDPAATNVSVTVKKLKMITVVGKLTVTSGTIDIAETGDLNVDVTIDAASYDTGNEKRDTHVVSADFLDAETFPTISFAAKATATGTGAVTIPGTVTVKGDTSPIELSVDSIDVKGDTATFVAKTVVSRHALGVTKMPNLVIAKDLDVTITAKATLG